jgi:hypothetical protein
MTGYLQRMAERALRPERAIRPMFGSVFAPIGRAAASETPTLEEDVFSATEDRPAPTWRSPLDTQPSSPPLRSAPSDNRAAALYAPLMTPTTEPADRIEPLTPAQRAPITSLPAPSSAARDTDEPGDQQMRPAAEATPSRRQTPSRVETVETLLPPQPVEATVRLPRPADTRPRPNAANSRAALRDNHPTAPDDDDIQIHIGRIEVTAVRPTPAPQAAAKTRRGAPSLDDYIRRRDGRVP